MAENKSKLSLCPARAYSLDTGRLMGVPYYSWVTFFVDVFSFALLRQVVSSESDSRSDAKCILSLHKSYTLDWCNYEQPDIKGGV